MNLANEYLVRSGAVRNLFRTPSTLALKPIWEKERMWVTFNENDDHRIVVSTWNLSRPIPSGEELPLCDIRVLDKEELFHPGLVVPDGYRPIRYLECSTKANLNTYNKPMDKASYEYYWTHVFNSEYHQNFKTGWLWDSFIRLHEGKSSVRHLFGNCKDESVYHLFCEELYRLEMYGDVSSILTSNTVDPSDRLLDRWRIWKRTLDIQNLAGAANELVFA